MWATWTQTAPMPPMPAATQPAAPPLPSMPPPPDAAPLPTGAAQSTAAAQPIIGPVLPGASGVTVAAHMQFAGLPGADPNNPYSQYTAAQYAAMTPEQQYALQQHWQQWQNYQQEYAKWHAQYGEQYKREMAAAAGVTTASTNAYSTSYTSAQPPLPPADTATAATVPVPAGTAAISSQPQMYAQPPPATAAAPQQQSQWPQHSYQMSAMNFNQPPPSFQQAGAAANYMKQQQQTQALSVPPPQQQQQQQPTVAQQPTAATANQNFAGAAWQQQQSSANMATQGNAASFDNNRSQGNSNEPWLNNNNNNNNNQNSNWSAAGNNRNQSNQPNFGANNRNDNNFRADPYKRNDDNWQQQRGTGQDNNDNRPWQNNQRNNADERNRRSQDNRWGGNNSNQDDRNRWSGNGNEQQSQQQRWGSNNFGGNERNDRGYGNNNNRNSFGSNQQQPTPQRADLQNIEDFDCQFRKWEDQFENWKCMNANHPDRELYNKCERDFENQRTRLLERREQLLRKIGINIPYEYRPQQPNVQPTNAANDREIYQQQQQTATPFKQQQHQVAPLAVEENTSSSVHSDTKTDSSGQFAMTNSKQQPQQQQAADFFTPLKKDAEKPAPIVSAQPDKKLPEQMQPQQKPNVFEQAEQQTLAKSQRTNNAGKRKSRFDAPKDKPNVVAAAAEPAVIINLDDDDEDANSEPTKDAEPIREIFNKSADGIPGLDLVTDKSNDDEKPDAKQQQQHTQQQQKTTKVAKEEQSFRNKANDGPTRPAKMPMRQPTFENTNALITPKKIPSLFDIVIEKPVSPSPTATTAAATVVEPFNDNTLSANIMPGLANALKDNDLMQKIQEALAQAQGIDKPDAKIPLEVAANQSQDSREGLSFAEWQQRNKNQANKMQDDESRDRQSFGSNEQSFDGNMRNMPADFNRNNQGFGGNNSNFANNFGNNNPNFRGGPNFGGGNDGNFRGGPNFRGGNAPNFDGGPNFRGGNGPNFDGGPNFRGGNGPNFDGGPNFRGGNGPNFDGGPNFRGGNGPNFDGGPNFGQRNNGPWDMNAGSNFGPNGPNNNFGPNRGNFNNMPNFNNNFGGNFDGRGNFGPNQRGNFGAPNNQRGGNGFNQNRNFNDMPAAAGGRNSRNSERFDDNSNFNRNFNDMPGSGGRNSRNSERFDDKPTDQTSTPNKNNPFRRNTGVPAPNFEDNAPKRQRGRSNERAAQGRAGASWSAGPGIKREEADAFFQPMQVIDYQNNQAAPKVFDYGHKKADDVADFRAIQTFDYGHTANVVNENVVARQNFNPNLNVNANPNTNQNNNTNNRMGMAAGKKKRNKKKKNNNNTSEPNARNVQTTTTPQQQEQQQPQQQQVTTNEAKAANDAATEANTSNVVKPKDSAEKNAAAATNSTDNDNKQIKEKAAELKTQNAAEKCQDLEEISDTEENMPEEDNSAPLPPPPPVLTKNASKRYQESCKTNTAIFPSTANANNKIEAVSTLMSIPTVENRNTISVEEIICKPGRLTRPKKIVMLLRGPPGSGKSYVAKLIKEKEVEMGGPNPRILSIDDYFLIENDYEERDAKTGKKIPKKEILYEYDKLMEPTYMQYLIKGYKKTVTDHLYELIIVDCNNNSLRTLNEFYCLAKDNGYVPYIIDLLCDLETCLNRNTHERDEKDIRAVIDSWNETPFHYIKLDVSALLENVVEMEDVENMATDSNMMDETTGKKTDSAVIDVDAKTVNEATATEEEDSNEATEACGFLKSKWESDNSTENLARLDGMNKVIKRNATMEDYLQIDDWVMRKSNADGKKRVRWADIEEKRAQDKMRAIGFVVGQTDWQRMMDPHAGNRALNKTKFIERANRGRRRF